MNLLSKNHPVWGIAFRPFYPLAALYGTLSILLWSFGYQGTAALPNYFWHAHEMIWGYAGAVVVAFLLTAVTTWTKQPRTWVRLHAAGVLADGGSRLAAGHHSDADVSAPGKPTSPACSSFTASLLPYTWYYLHWLTAPMVDGKKSRVAGYLKPPTQ